MKVNKLVIGLGILTLAACSAEELPDVIVERDDFAYIDGDKVVVNMSLATPDMQDVSSRALDSMPDYNDMHLYLVEFDDNGGPLVNTLRKVYTPEEETPQSDRIRYKVTLDQTDRPRVLHLIALPKNEKLKIDYGVEASVIPSLKTTGGTPAYWRRLSFPNGYINGSKELAVELDQLKHVALIRNFACISMSNETEGRFTLKGFAIINNPESGTIAPFKTADYTFPEFLKAGENNTFEYKVLSQTYPGIAPSNLTLANQSTDPTGPVVGDDSTPKYIYERPFSSIRHTYVIIKGRRTGDTEDTYYKLDLGHNDDDGIFRYFGILRNYNYNIVLKNVATQGYKTALEAAQGVVYNNFSFDVELSSMMNISDGDEVVYVNFTTAVLTDEKEEQVIEFKYRYRSLSSSNPTYNNDDANFIDLKPGSVIKSVDEEGKTDDSDGWRTVKLTVYAAQTETKRQSFTIVKKSGLGRTINLILHRKWTLTNPCEYAGTLENWDGSSANKGIAGPEIGDSLTIFFDIPDNLEEAMFPLTFTLEADRQNIENNPLGKLIVTYGNSGFAGLPGYPATISGRHIKYEKQVTWTEYNDPLKANDPYDNGTAIPNGDGTYTHRIRCRFRTTTQLDDFDFDESETVVLITNPNFNYAMVPFTRVQKTL